MKEHFSEELEVVKKLLKEPETTDPNNWPHRYEIIYTKENPELWTYICEEAYKECDESRPVLKIWLLLEQINGLRRQEQFDQRLAMVLLEEINRRIDALPDSHPRKSRLMEMYFYNASYVYFPIGEFKKAAECNLKEAEVARKAGDKRGELIALFNAAFQQLNAAITSNRNVKRAYKSFAYAGLKLRKRIAGSIKKFDIQWMANLTHNMALYNWFVNKKVPDKKTLEFFKNLPADIRKTFADPHEIILAIIKIEQNPADLVDITMRISETDTSTYSMAIVVSAWAYLEMKEYQGLNNAIRRIKRKEGVYGTHVAQAICRHSLSKEMGKQAKNLSQKIQRRENQLSEYNRDSASAFPESLPSKMIAYLKEEIAKLQNELDNLLSAREATK